LALSKRVEGSVAKERVDDRRMTAERERFKENDGTFRIA
jgi:hypothetical protein